MNQRKLQISLMSVCFLSAETPIEEFTPTPAFPALQYLESVDVEGVAWRAGLRTGDFLIEVMKDSASLASSSSSSSVSISLPNMLLMALNGEEKHLQDSVQFCDAFLDKTHSSFFTCT